VEPKRKKFGKGIRNEALHTLRLIAYLEGEVKKKGGIEIQGGGGSTVLVILIEKPLVLSVTKKNEGKEVS